MSSGGVLSTFSGLNGDSEEARAFFTLQCSWELGEDLSTGLGSIGDFRGAVKFLFASRDAKPGGR